MRKFLLGLFTGMVLVGLAVVIATFSAIRLSDRTPVISDGSTLVLDLRGGVPEKPPVSYEIPFISSPTPVTVQEIWSTLRRAATDPKIKALFLNVGQIDGGWAKANEI